MGRAVPSSAYACQAASSGASPTDTSSSAAGSAAAGVASASASVGVAAAAVSSQASSLAGAAAAGSAERSTHGPKEPSFGAHFSLHSLEGVQPSALHDHVQLVSSALANAAMSATRIEDDRIAGTQSAIVLDFGGYV